MKTTNLLNRILLCMVSIFFVFNMAYSDIFIKQKLHSDGMQIMGHSQPATDEIQSIWMTENKMKNDSEKQSILMLLDEKKIYIINHVKKTYSEIPMDIGKLMNSEMDEQAESEENMEQFKKFAQGMMKVKFTVTPTDETKKIKEWNCKKYVQEIETVMGPISSEIWATEDLEMDYNQYAKLSSAMLTMQPGLQSMLGDAIKEMEKIKGVQILNITSTKMMGMEVKTTQELIEFKEGKAPDGTFDIPKGYKKVKKF